MNTIPLSDINQIYFCSKEHEIQSLYPLEHPEFRDFCLALKKFERKLRKEEEIEEDYWRTFLRPLRRYRFQLSAAPLPFCYPVIEESELAEFTKKMAICNSIYPAFALDAIALFERVTNLSKLTANPILDLITSLYSKGKKEKVALLLKESHLIPAVKEILSDNPKLRHLELVSPFQLRENHCYQSLVVVGAVRWFPDYVFSAPRAPKIQLIHYSWIRSKWNPEPVFIGSAPWQPPKLEKANLQLKTERLEDYLDPDDILPTINWSQILQGFSRSSVTSPDQKEVKARLFLLEGNTGIFLDADASAIVIDLREDDESRVNSRIDVTDIEPGMFVLLRTSGGGDYILNLADRILGAEAQHLRALQNEWKSLLRQRGNSSSLHNVSKCLSQLGSPRSNQVNVRNWMSDKFIRPDDDKDFDAILCLVGLKDRTNEFYEAASAILSAHRKAGQHIRDLLLEKVFRANLHQLKQLGRMTFELDEVDSGSMTAFQVVDIDPELRLIPVSKIAQLFEIEREGNHA